MKKYTTLSLLLIALTNVSFAQGIYFKIGGGYGLPIATSIIGQQQTRNQDQTGNNNTNIETTKNTSASFIAGANGNIGVGFMFSKYLGAEITAQYVAGKTYKIYDVYNYKSDNLTGSQWDKSSISCKAIYINPSFIITPGSKLPYGRFGFILGAPKIKEESSHYYDLDGTSTSSTKGELKNNLSVGFQGALGMKWTLGNKIDLFTEVSVISMTVYTKEYTLTESISNGTDNLAAMQTYYKKTVYKKEITVDNSASTDINKPRQAIRESNAFSSISLQVGIVYLLQKRNVE
jgi:hypothetical protein